MVIIGRNGIMKGFRMKWAWSYSKSLGVFKSYNHEGEPLDSGSEYILKEVKRPKIGGF